MAKEKQDEWEEINPEEVPVWEPKEGEEVIGYLEKVDEGVGPNNSRLYTLRLLDDTLLKIWGSSVLDKRMDFISIGEKIKIRYEGKAKSEKTKRSYHLFSVFRSKNKDNNDDIPVVD